MKEDIYSHRVFSLKKSVENPLALDEFTFQSDGAHATFHLTEALRANGQKKK